MYVEEFGSSSGFRTPIIRDAIEMSHGTDEMIEDLADGLSPVGCAEWPY